MGMKIQKQLVKILSECGQSVPNWLKETDENKANLKEQLVSNKNEFSKFENKMPNKVAKKASYINGEKSIEKQIITKESLSSLNRRKQDSAKAKIQTANKEDKNPITTSKKR